MMNDLNSLKSMYRILKNDPQSRESFLDGIVSQCKHVKFDRYKTKIFLALVRNLLPEVNQKFTECDKYEEFDVEFNKKFDEEWK